MADVIPSELALSDEPFDDETLDLVLDLPDEKFVELEAELGDDADAELTWQEQQALEVKRWLPADRGAAEWAMRKLRELELEHGQALADAAEWHRQIDEWRDAVTKRLERRSLHFQGALIGYVRQRIDADPKAGTLTLPSGAVRVTRRKARVALDDRELAAQSAAANLEGDELEQTVRMPPPPAPVADARAVAKRAKIVTRAKRRCWRIELEGHVVIEAIVPGDADPPKLGDGYPYDDGIEERELEIVGLDVLGEELEDVAVWADTGQPIAGARVEPARIDFTVET